MDRALGIPSRPHPHFHPSDDRPCYASENPRPKGGTESRFINPDCLTKMGVCPIPAEPVQSLPCQIQEDKIELEQRNGILLLKILKAEPEALAQEQLEVTQSEQPIHQQHRQMTG